MLMAASADIPKVKSPSASTVPINPHSTVTRATPTAVARVRTMSKARSSHGGSAFRKREGEFGLSTALSSICTTLAWISTPGIGSVLLRPKLVVTSFSSFTPARPSYPTSTILPWIACGSAVPLMTSAKLM